MIEAGKKGLLEKRQRHYRSDLGKYGIVFRNGSW
jgi:hypothetical protein